MKLNYSFEIRHFFLKQIANSRSSGGSPVRRADAALDLISLKVHLKLAAPDFFSREFDPAIAFATGFHRLS